MCFITLYIFSSSSASCSHWIPLSLQVIQINLHFFLRFMLDKSLRIINGMNITKIIGALGRMKSTIISGKKIMMNFPIIFDILYIMAGFRQSFTKLRVKKWCTIIMSSRCVISVYYCMFIYFYYYCTFTLTFFVTVI